MQHRELGGTTRVPTITDFRFIKALSRGAYGRVFLAQRRITNDFYAIKVLRKREVITDRHRRNILMEVVTLSLTYLHIFIFFYALFSLRNVWSLSPHSDCSFHLNLNSLIKIFILSEEHPGSSQQSFCSAFILRLPYKVPLLPRLRVPTRR